MSKETVGMTLNKPFIVGITGGIATGKSTAAALISERGYTVVDADKIAREVVEPGQLGNSAIKDNFPSVWDERTEEIDRKKLAEIIFADPSQRARLDNLLHPIINAEITNIIEKCKDEIIFLDIPLLFETLEKTKTGSRKYDQIWLIYADKNTQIERLKERNGLTVEEANQRIMAQTDIEIKKELADVIINNTGTVEELRTQIEQNLDKLHQELLKDIHYDKHRTDEVKDCE